MKILNIIDETIAKIEKVLVIILLSLMVIVGFAQVILRNFLETGLMWADPLLRYTVLWIAFIGASLATREDKHINIDVLTRLLNPRLKKLASIITNLFALSICLILFKTSIDFVKMEMEFQSEVFLGVKNWMVEMIIPIGFCLVSLRFLFRVVKIIFTKNIL